VIVSVRVTITFKTAKLQRIFNSHRNLVREYGEQNAARIAVRMAVLLQAPNLAAVPTGKPDRGHELKGNRRGQFAVDIVQPHRLVFRVSRDSSTQRQGRRIELGQVTAIEILGVEDYH
jgi:proteic killer suppression protein